MKEITITLTEKETEFLMPMLMGIALKSAQNALISGDTDSIEIAEVMKNIMEKIKDASEG